MPREQTDVIAGRFELQTIGKDAVRAKMTEIQATCGVVPCVLVLEHAHYRSLALLRAEVQRGEPRTSASARPGT